MQTRRAPFLVFLVGIAIIFFSSIAHANLAQLQKKTQKALQQNKALSQDLQILDYLQQKFSGGVWKVSNSNPTLSDVPRIEISKPALLPPAPLPTFIYVPLADDSGLPYQADESGFASLQTPSSLSATDKQAALFSFPPSDTDLPPAVRMQKYTDPNWILASYVNSLATDAEKRAVFPNKKITFEKFILKRSSLDEVGAVQVKIGSNTYDVPIQMGGQCDTTGGSISEISQSGLRFRIHQFTSVGTHQFNVSQHCPPMDILLVAGGGGGGYGGGGGGGVIFQSGLPIASGIYNVTVGAGGTPGNLTTPGTNGDPSSLAGPSTYHTANGGGGGGPQSGYIVNGQNGGSGGGAGLGTTVGQGTTLQGNNGGQAVKSTRRTSLKSFVPVYGGGGGGGAGQVGGNAYKVSNSFSWSSHRVFGGAGGQGRSISISGQSVFYGGGGGGSGDVEGGAGGAGGGGNGRGAGSTSSAGQAGLGGGGGGGSSGGSGIVIIKYQIE